MKIDLVKAYQGETALVVFATYVKKDKQETTKVTHAKVHGHLSASLADKSITGKSGEVVSFRDTHFEGHRHLVVIGVGNKLTHESVRQLAPTILSAVQGLKAKSVAVDFDGLPKGKKDHGSFIQAFAEGLVLSDYSFDELKSSKKKEDKKEELNIHLVTKSADATAKKALTEGVTLAETVNFSRRLGDLPGNLMTPSILADTVVQAVKGT
ncbi:MAG: M17 family peptidase N-terminal domain-containing protein, partial [Pseudobdellovibrionaceae bacterium]